MNKDYHDYRATKDTTDQCCEPKDLQWVCVRCGTHVIEEKCGYLYSFGRVERCEKCGTNGE